MTDTLMTAETTDSASTDAAAETTVDATVNTPEAAATEAADPTASQDGAKDGEDGGQPQDKSGEDQKDEGALTGAPEAYEDFTAPEGVELDAAAVEDLKALAKDANLSQAGAQKVADLGMKLAAKWGQDQADRVAEMQAGWVEAAKADKEIGGDALSENLSVAKKALDTYGSPELAALLNESRLGDHPEVIRFMRKVGLTLSEDTAVAPGTAEKPGRKATLYDNSNMN